MRTTPARPNVRLPRILGLCVLAVVLAGVAPAAAEEKASPGGYSAYSDPDKTALAVILSEEENVRELRREFGLDDRAVGRVLAAVREENERLAEEFAESEEIVAANRSLPNEEVADRISASDYGASVEDAIAETKTDVAATLPESGEEELRDWVDAQWDDEVAEASEAGSGRVVESKAGRALVCDRVFATQYRGFTRFEAALPHRSLKFGDRPEVPISRGRRTARPRIKEVGPWNTRDNYWRTGRQRDTWKNLPRCIPEARAAYYRDYNNGKDQFGREVLNPAGVDLTPAVARRLGLDRYQNAWVSVRFPFARR